MRLFFLQREQKDVGLLPGVQLLQLLDLSIGQRCSVDLGSPPPHRQSHHHHHGRIGCSRRVLPQLWPHLWN